MGLDAEGAYVAQLIDGGSSPPRPLASRTWLRLYTLSPNSRYYIFLGFFLIALEGFFLFSRPSQLREADRLTLTVTMALVGFLILLSFSLPLLNVRRISSAIRYGVNTIGRIERVQPARTGAYSTPAGMKNGAVEAIVSYSVNGQQHTSRLLLDRPWIRSVEVGSQLNLLIDPNSFSILYVVGLMDQKRR
jgi:hypothetical protein